MELHKRIIRFELGITGNFWVVYMRGTNGASDMIHYIREIVPKQKANIPCTSCDGKAICCTGQTSMYLCKDCVKPIKYIFEWDKPLHPALCDLAPLDFINPGIRAGRFQEAADKLVYHVKTVYLSLCKITLHDLAKLIMQISANILLADANLGQKYLLNKAVPGK